MKYAKQFLKIGELVPVVEAVQAVLKDGAPSYQTVIKWTNGKAWDITLPTVKQGRRKMTTTAAVRGFLDEYEWAQFLYDNVDVECELDRQEQERRERKRRRKQKQPPNDC